MLKIKCQFNTIYHFLQERYFIFEKYLCIFLRKNLIYLNFDFFRLKIRMNPVKNFVENNELLVVAHRGSSGTAPENTLSSFREALESGCQMIEVDVQLSSDNQFIAYHDFVPIGFNKKISDMTYNEISEIDVGFGFDTEFKGEKIPLLKDVIELVYNKNYLMIEIKTLAGNKFRENAEKLLELINHYNYIDKTIFGSFNHSALNLIKKLNPDIHTAAIKIPGDLRLPSQLKTSTNCDVFICAIEEINDLIVIDAKECGLVTGVYSIDTKESLIIALNNNIRAIATNYPKQIIEWIKEFNLS
jgi:glycerophosphoryl diester phosphodiesterase